jgi:predicted ATPase
LQLEGLQPEMIGDYLAAWFRFSRLPTRMARTLYERTEGNPRFINLFVRDWIARNMLREIGGVWNFSGDIEHAANTIPEVLRDTLEGRLEELSSEELEVLEVASMAGMEFSAPAVAAGLKTDIEHAEKRCEDLARRFQFVRRDRRAAVVDVAHYRFLHALERSVLEERILPARRKQLEERIGGLKLTKHDDYRRDIRGGIREWRLDSRS